MSCRSHPIFTSCRVHDTDCTCYRARDRAPVPVARALPGPRSFRFWFRWWAAGVLAVDTAIALVAHEHPWLWLHVGGLAVFLWLLDRGFRS